jgi:hypothetical protein
MSMIIKPLANVISLTSQNTVYSSSLIYLSVGSSIAAQVNLYSNSSTQYASFVLPINTYIFVQKNTTDLISSNTAVSASPAAYKS